MQSNRPRTRKPGLPQPIGESSPVAALAQKARALDALDRQLRQSLPEPLRSHVRMADFGPKRLVFLADSSAWASKLRFHQTALLALARQVSGLPAEKFAVKVAPLPPVPPEQIRRKPLSKNTAEHLKAAARSVADPELAAVYLQMASLAEDSSPPPASGKRRG